MKRAIVLGAGMVGRTLAADLARNIEVTVADVREHALASVASTLGVRTVRADLSDARAIADAVAGHDIVLGALSSAMGLATLRAVVEAKKPYVDISFMADDPSEVNAVAEKNGVTAVVDCGIGPGVTNAIAGFVTAALSPCRRLDIALGGVPVVRSQPYEYKCAFALADVFEEYTRPARWVRDGREIVIDPLTEVVHIDVAGVGTLEAFATDGLRTLLRTLDVPEMTERTMRWPGHAALMRTFQSTGLFDTRPITAGGVTVRPLDVTAALLANHWTYDEGEEDMTIVVVSAEGDRDGVPTRYGFELVDRYDRASRTTSMSRATAFPAAIVARMVLDGRFTRPGVHPPEVLGREPGLLDVLLDELARRGVVFRRSVTHL